MPTLAWEIPFFTFKPFLQSSEKHHPAHIFQPNLSLSMKTIYPHSGFRPTFQWCQHMSIIWIYSAPLVFSDLRKNVHEKFNFPSSSWVFAHPAFQRCTLSAVCCVLGHILWTKMQEIRLFIQFQADSSADSIFSHEWYAQFSCRSINVSITERESVSAVASTHRSV